MSRPHTLLEILLLVLVLLMFRAGPHIPRRVHHSEAEVLVWAGSKRGRPGPAPTLECAVQSDDQRDSLARSALNWTEIFNFPIFHSPGMGNLTEEKKLLGYCVPGCVDYQFDDEFWVSTMVTQWDLVCEKSWLKTLAKLLLFTGWQSIY